MADEKSSSMPGAAPSDRAQMQGLALGQEEMRQQQAPANPDRSSQADLVGQEPGDLKAAVEPRAFQDERGREVADTQAVGDLGVGTPPGVDVHNLGQSDRPQEEWGEPAGEAATFSSNHTRKGLRTEAERGQGAKTRQANKDIFSRRT